MLAYCNLAATGANPDPGAQAFAPRGQTFDLPLDISGTWTHWNGSFGTSWNTAFGWQFTRPMVAQARWRASKGAAPVGRFTRSFGDNATEGWHRSMPVGFAAAGPLTMTLNAIVAFSGASALVTLRDLAASLAFAGDTLRAAFSAVAGAFDFAGALAATTVLSRTLDGAASFAGAISGATQRALSGAASFAGEALRSANNTIAGILNFAGALTASIALARTLDGTASFAGAITRAGQRAVDGAVLFAGDLARTVALSLVLAGVVTWQGALSSLSQLSQVVQGVLSVTGVLAAVRLVVNTLTLSSDLSFTKQLERFKRRMRFRSIFPGADPHRRYPPR